MCVRLELGPRDMKSESVLAVRRDTGAKESISWADLPARLPAVLQEMQAALLAAARRRVDATLTTVRAMHSTGLAVAASPLRS